MEGSITSADIIDLEDAKKLIEAQQKGSDVKIVWNESYAKSRAFDFRLDSIKRVDNDQELLVSWNGKAIGADIADEETVLIPGKNNFKVTKVDIANGKQQYISINFSDPVDKAQNFRGLIAIQNVQRPQFVVDGNVLKVFTGSRLTGTSTVDIFEGVKNTDGYKI